MKGLLGFNRKKTAGVDRQCSISETRYVVIDTELTGLDEKRDSIVSLGAVRMVGGRIDLNDSFYRLINPETELTAQSIVIHQIMPSEVELKPDIDTVLSEFLEFCGTDIIVGHCLAIDLSFINREMKKRSGAELKNGLLDTLALYQALSKRVHNHKIFATPLRDYSLYGLARHLDIPVSSAHNAMMDAFLTAQIFQRFIPLLLQSGIQEIGDLLRIGCPLKGGDRFRSSSMINF
ncbi:MAG: PolC-type DNA polymerase III [Nitrospirota bacterium]